MNAWDVWSNGKMIDTVWYLRSISADTVCQSLINHDGYPGDITVVPAAHRISSSALLNPNVALADARPYNDRQQNISVV